MIEINISPIAFTIGTVAVRWYGIMVALAVLTVVLWALRAVKKGGKLSYETVLNAALVGIPSGIIGSRLFHVLENWRYYFQNPGQIVGGAGLAIYGAVLGAALGIWIYSKIKKFSFGYLGDVLAPGIILAQAIGRVGCTLNGCCYGVETTSILGIIYANPETYAPIGIGVYPTQIFEIVYDLLVFGVLLSLRGRFKPDGSLFFIYLSLYSVWRLGIDFIREGTPLIFGLHEAQIISILVLAVTLPMLALKTRWAKAKSD